jgi:hypothetical protein
MTKYTQKFQVFLHLRSKPNHLIKFLLIMMNAFQHYIKDMPKFPYKLYNFNSNQSAVKKLFNIQQVFHCRLL